MKSLSWAVVVALVIGAGGAAKVFAHGKDIAVGGGGGGPVKLTAVQMASIGVQTAKADFRAIDSILILNGSVKIDPDRHAHVTTRISGRIEKLFASLGDHVEKGQPLALIQSRQLGDPPPEVEIKAPVAGIVNERGVSLGDAAEPNTELFHIVDLSKVYLVADAYEEDAGKVQPGQKVRVIALSYPQDSFDGQIAFVGQELNADTRTLPVWIRVDNPAGKLRAEMFAKAIVLLAQNPDLLTVPKDAVLEEGGEKFVFVRTGDTFNRVDVQAGMADDRFVEIKDGLVPGDDVVVQGQREIFTAWLTGGAKPAADKD